MQTMNTNTTEQPIETRKIQQYGWKPIGPRGEFCWIHKNELNIDRSYQRDRHSESKLSAMAGQWDWVNCGALSVMEMDGKWWVVDGQNRKLAADKRVEITELPCMVFFIRTQKEAAAAFVRINNSRTSVGGIDKFKAMIVAGDQSAFSLLKLIESTGHKVGTSATANVVSCVICLWKYYNRNPETMKRIWPLISDVASDAQITDTLVNALWGAEMAANEINLSITGHPYRSALISAGAEVLLAHIRREKGIVGHGGEKVEAIAAIKWINKQKLGTKKLSA